MNIKKGKYEFSARCEICSKYEIFVDDMTIKDQDEIVLHLERKSIQKEAFFKSKESINENTLVVV